ncbi:hypothetical protein HOY82DRAFT_16544 [Tuber indicum]|nr:hypothetical protein HOY82DRAFT_16544 [Tuber indicum]
MKFRKRDLVFYFVLIVLWRYVRSHWSNLFLRMFCPFQKGNSCNDIKRKLAIRVIMCAPSPTPTRDGAGTLESTLSAIQRPGTSPNAVCDHTASGNMLVYYSAKPFFSHTSANLLPPPKFCPNFSSYYRKEPDTLDEICSLNAFFICFRRLIQKE